MRWLFLVGLVGCYAPTPVPGAPCAADGSCPTGLVCAADRCVLPGAGVDAPVDADDASIDATADAMLDAMPDAGPPLPLLVQQATNFATPGTQVTASFPAAPAIGNLLVAVGGCPTSSLASISGGALAWQRAAFSTMNANIEVFIGVATGDKTVTATLPSCGSQISLSISEWDHLATMPIDQASADDGVASPASAGTISTTGTRLVLFSVSNYTPNTFGTPSGGPWSELAPVDDFVEVRTWYRVVTAPGTFAPSVTETGNEWDATLLSLKAP